MNERHDDLQEIIDAALREMAAEEGRAGRARRPHRPGGRPPAEGRHQLAGDIRAAARPGLRRRPHHGEDLYRRAPGPRAREEAAGGPAGLPRPALQDGARRGLPDGLGLRRGRAPWRGAGADRLLRHGLPPLRGAPTSSSSRTRARRTSSSGCCTRSRRWACPRPCSPTT